MKNTSGTKMLIFSFAFAAMSYFMASPMDSEMVDLPLEPETASGEQVVTANQMISAATEEMRDAIAIFNTPVKSGWFGLGGNSKKPLELGKIYPVWCYLSALLNLGEHGHLVEQLGKKLRLPNEDADKAMAFRWADDLSVCGQPSVLYAFIDYLAECARNNPDLVDDAIRNSIIDLSLLGLISVTYASRSIGQKTELQENAINALKRFYVSVLLQASVVKSVDAANMTSIRNIISKNNQYWPVDATWLNAVNVSNSGLPVFGKEKAADVDMTQSELMAEDSSTNSFEYELTHSINCVLQNVSSWLSEK